MEDDDLLELKSREKVKVLNGACMNSEMTKVCWESGRQMRGSTA